MDRQAVAAKLHPIFVRFDRVVRMAVGASCTARLYWFPESVVAITQRRELTADSFSDFLAYARARDDRDVWVWEPAEASLSPEQLPASVELAVRVTSQPAAPLSRLTGRSSQIQKEFRAALIRRDGVVCTLCRLVPAVEKDVEAAHVVRHGSSLAVMEEAGLISTNDCRNGVMLCATPCHFWYDQLHWWLEDDGTVAASDAVIADAHLGLHFRPLLGKPLLTPRPTFLHFWPLPSTWAVQKRLSQEATAERRDLAFASPFPCARCGVRYKTAQGLEHHAKKVQGN